MIKSMLTATMLVCALTFASPAAEAGTTNAFVNTAVDRPVITAGQTVTVSTTLTANGVPLGGQTVSLYAKPAGAADYVFVVEKVTSNGNASVSHLSMKNVDYQWRCDAGDVCPEGTPNSSAVHVGVKTKVTMRLQDATISPGQKMVALGTTSPNKAGARATVWRIRMTGRTEKWFSGTVRADGSFKLVKRVPATVKYKVYVVVARYDGNLKGVSETRTLYVA